jgi:hypothetical protein
MPSRFGSGPEFENYALFHPEARIFRPTPKQVRKQEIRAAIAHCISSSTL